LVRKLLWLFGPAEYLMTAEARLGACNNIHDIALHRSYMPTNRESELLQPNSPYFDMRMLCTSRPCCLYADQRPSDKNFINMKSKEDP